MRTALLGLALILTGPAAAIEPADAGAKKTAVDFRQPTRDYVAVSGAWPVYVEKPLFDRKPELGQRAAAKLADTLTHIRGKLPVKSRGALAGINFYLLWGTDSPQGGRSSGMSYIRKGEPRNYPHLDPRWEHAIVIYSADNLMYLDTLWTRKSLMHELAHAWHIANWPEKHPPIYDAWRRSRDGALYHNVKDYKGRTLAVAYASKNALEYFAELSAMYFVGGNYPPFDKQGLQTYDPAGYAMVESLWGVGTAPSR